MYRYIVDNAVTYTQDDLVLFRESPFALWMERLTLENPDHGIPADMDSVAPPNRSERQEDIVATLRSEGRNVALIDWDLEEPERRTATLEAMRDGADFIVNGQLAYGCLAGGSSLLMRTSGYSDLGDFLYIPCETNVRNTLQSAFRLCFVADLLQHLQGQLPPQMLIIRGGAEVVPLQTDDYIYYYRAVQKRFMHAMLHFRKHRMPDPAESSHFGRWAECASEVLKQRALSEQQRADEQQAPTAEAPTRLLPEHEEESTEIMQELPQLKVASGASAVTHFDSEASQLSGSTSAHSSQESTARLGAQSSHIYTLAEQARLLEPGRFSAGKAPGHTPNLARYSRPRVVAEGENNPEGHHRRSSDAALENLEFIGSGPNNMAVDMTPLTTVDDSFRPAPTPRLREMSKRDMAAHEPENKAESARLPELEPRTPVFLPPDTVRAVEPMPERPKPQVKNAPEAVRVTRSVIDLDSAPAPGLAPVVQRAEAEFERLVREDPMFKRSAPHPQTDQSGGGGSKREPDISPFSSSLITSDEFSDS
ncbi:MAG: hypothetical protein R3E64_10315 [Halioglobus sp.]